MSICFSYEDLVTPVAARFGLTSEEARVISFFGDGPNRSLCAAHSPVWTKASVTKGLKQYARAYPKSDPADQIKELLANNRVPSDAGCAALFWFYLGYSEKRDTTGEILVDGHELTVHVLNALDVSKLNECAISLLKDDVELFEMYSSVPRALEERFTEVEAIQKARNDKREAERKEKIDYLYAVAEKNADDVHLLDGILEQLRSMNAPCPAKDTVLGQHLDARTNPNGNVVPLNKAVVH